MSIAEPFIALAPNYGFPMSYLEQAGTPRICMPDYPDGSLVNGPSVFSGLTQEEMMHFYWNARNLRLRLDIDIQYEFGVRLGANEYEYSVHTETWTCDVVSDVARDLQGVEFTPDRRGCPNIAGLGVFGEVDSGRIQTSISINLHLGVFLNGNCSFWKSGDSFHYNASNANIGLRSNLHGGFTTIGSFSLFRIPALGDIRDNGNFDMYLQNHQFWLRSDSETKDFTGPSYLSHTLRDFRLDMDFYTYV